MTPNSASPHSRGTAPTTLSNESPSTAQDAASQTSTHGADVAMEYGTNPSPQTHIANASSSDARRPSIPDGAGSAHLSLEYRRGHSNQLIGLSNESDPYLLRHYYYNSEDVYPMFRLHFRKVVDDSSLPPPPNRYSEDDATSCSRGPIPSQFLLKDEAVWKEDLKQAEGIFNGNHTEQDDIDLLDHLVPSELGSRLMKL